MDAIIPLQISEPYEERPIKLVEIAEDAGWTFKIYSVVYKKNAPPDERTIEMAKQFAKDCIEKYHYIADSYGLGYIIIHKGMDSNFIVINWWLGENMICTHTFLSPLNNQYLYQEITHTGMNVCVWDELVHYHERNAWVNFIMKKPACPDIKGYIADIYKNDK